MGRTPATGRFRFSLMLRVHLLSRLFQLVSRVPSADRSENRRHELLHRQSISVRVHSVSCEVDNEYLLDFRGDVRNEKYGGVEANHLLIERENDPRLCLGLDHEETANSYEPTDERTRTELRSIAESAQGRFLVDVETGQSNQPRSPIMFVCFI